MEGKELAFIVSHISFIYRVLCCFFLGVSLLFRPSFIPPPPYLLGHYDGSFDERREWPLGCLLASEEMGDNSYPTFCASSICP